MLGNKFLNIERTDSSCICQDQIQPTGYQQEEAWFRGSGSAG